VIAITIDDMPVHGPMAGDQTRLSIARDIIAALQAEKAPAVGFINAVSVEQEPETEAVLREWAAAGLALGNHTWSHARLDDVSAEAYGAEIAGDEVMLQRLSPTGDWHWFRYPYLAEGMDPEKRAAVRRILAERGYKIAAVTMDFGDWQFNNAYGRCAAKGNKKAMAKLEQQFLEDARISATYFREIAQKNYGRDIPYVLLLHIGTVDAKVMPQLLALYREMGFGFITLEEAQRDPAYAADTDPSLPARPASPEGQLAEKGLSVPEPKRAGPHLDKVCN
jgi:peptidoglycan/xylan/chitin deacetylase (PgdA/CDA1 family)